MRSNNRLLFLPFRSYFSFLLCCIAFGVFHNRLSDNLQSLCFGVLWGYFLVFVPLNIELINGHIKKRYLFINIKDFDLDSIFETRLFEYINRLKIKEQNLEVRSDRYYKIQLVEKNNRIMINRKYKEKNGLSMIDYLPGNAFRKAKLVQRVNWLR